MFGFVFGVLFLFGLLAFVRGRHCRGGGWRHGRHHAHGGWHDDDRAPRRRGRGRGRFGAGFARAAGEVVKRRLDVDEDQEGIVDLALADLRKTMTGLTDALRDSRHEVVGAFRGDTVDDAALAAVFARQDEELARARREAISALKQIHAVLEPAQREAAVGWLASDDLRFV